MKQVTKLQLILSLYLFLVANLSFGQGQVQFNKGITLEDVEGIIERLEDKNAVRENINVGVMPFEVFNKIDQVPNHVQGVAKLANGNYVFSHDTRSGETESILAFHREGQDAVYRAYDNGDTIRHPGAIQAVGNIIVVPSTRNDRRINFWDASDPNNPVHLTHLTRPTNTPNTGSWNASDAGIVYHEQDDRYYVAVGTAFDDEQSGRPVLIYASQVGKELTDISNYFEYMGRSNLSSQSQGGFSLMYENTGKLYGADLLRGADGWENIRLYEIDLSTLSTTSATNSYTLKKNIRLGSRSGVERNWLGPGFRWGGTIVPTSPNSVDVIGVERKLQGGVGGPVACGIKTWRNVPIDECLAYSIKVNDEDLFFGSHPDVPFLVSVLQDSPLWNFTYHSDDNTYSIRLQETNAYLTAPESPGQLNGNALVLSHVEEPERSRWELMDLGDNNVRLVPKKVYPSNTRKAIKYVASSDVNLKLSTNLDMVGIANQKFQLMPVLPTVGITCNNATITVEDSYATLEVEDILASYSASSNCLVDLILSKDQFICSDVGTHQVSLTLSVAGLSETCTSSVTVTNETMPGLICPENNQTRNTNTGTCFFEVIGSSFDASAFDFCGSVTITNDFTNSETIAGAEFPLGFTTIVYTATDESLNASTCSITVEVIDNKPPTVDCKPAIVYLNSSGNGAIDPTDVYQEGSAADNCGSALIESVSPNTFTCANLGENQVTLTVHDGNGNTGICTATVTVADTEKPTLNCSGLTVTIPNDPGECEASVVLSVPTAADNCAVATLEYRYRAVDAANNPIGPWSAWADETDNARTFDVGRYRIRWRAIDASGNTKGCTRYLTVEDAESPVVDCFNQIITMNGEETIALEINDLSTADDNCGIASHTIDIEDVFCEDLGQQIVITTTAVDVNGLINTCTSTVDIEGMPCGWSQQADGVGCENGSDVAYDLSNEIFTVNSTDCFNPPSSSSDEYAFAQYNLCGSGEIIAKVTDISGTSSGWAGVMMRESNDPQAKLISMMTNLGSNHRKEARTVTGGSVTSQFLPAFNRHWLRIKRTGNSFRIYTSSNGASWFLKASHTIVMESCIEIGLAVNGYNGSSDISATFENVSIEGTTIFELNSSSEEGAVAYSNSVRLAAVKTTDLQVYPNPTDGQFTIQLGDFLDQEGELEVLNVHGQVIRVIRKGFFEYAKEEVNLMGLPAGIYYVRLRLADGTIQFKRVILQPRS